MYFRLHKLDSPFDQHIPENENMTNTLHYSHKFNVTTHTGCNQCTRQSNNNKKIGGKSSELEAKSYLEKMNWTSGNCLWEKWKKKPRHKTIIDVNQFNLLSFDQCFSHFFCAPDFHRIHFSAFFFLLFRNYIQRYHWQINWIFRWQSFTMWQRRENSVDHVHSPTDLTKGRIHTTPHTHTHPHPIHFAIWLMLPRFFCYFSCIMTMWVAFWKCNDSKRILFGPWYMWFDPPPSIHTFWCPVNSEIYLFSQSTRFSHAKSWYSIWFD